MSYDTIETGGSGFYYNITPLNNEVIISGEFNESFNYDNIHFNHPDTTGNLNGFILKACSPPWVNISSPPLIQNALSVFPNPANTILKLQSNNFMPLGEVKIFDSMGNEVASFSTDQGEYILETDKFEAGVYQILSTNKGMTSQNNVAVIH